MYAAEAAPLPPCIKSPTKAHSALHGNASSTFKPFETKQPYPHLVEYLATPYMSVNAAARELVGAKSECYLPGLYFLVSGGTYHYQYRFRSNPLHTEASIWYHSSPGGLRWPRKITQLVDVRDRYIARFPDDPGPVFTDLPVHTLNSALKSPCRSWCFQTSGRINPLRGVVHGNG